MMNECRRVGTARTTTRAIGYILRYFEDNHNELRSGRPTPSFLVERPACPEQHNIYDSGVFACQFFNYLISDVPLDFTEADMPMLRERLAAEMSILQGSAAAPASPHYEPEPSP